MVGVVVAYRKLSPVERRRGGVRAAARAWVLLLRRAAARVAVRVRLQRAARRRCGGARRLTWAGLCGRGVAAATRRISPSSSSAAGGGAGSYDPASYARNFDDGVWKVEEGVSWSAGRPLACRIADVANGNSRSNPR
ncbi:hypothetical protein ABZP36_025814 [Zizania latifolia]